MAIRTGLRWGRLSVARADADGPRRTQAQVRGLRTVACRFVFEAFKASEFWGNRTLRVNRNHRQI